MTYSFPLPRSLSRVAPGRGMLASATLRAVPHLHPFQRTVASIFIVVKDLPLEESGRSTSHSFEDEHPATESQSSPAILCFINLFVPGLDRIAIIWPQDLRSCQIGVLATSWLDTLVSKFLVCTFVFLQVPHDNHIHTEDVQKSLINACRYSCCFFSVMDFSLRVCRALREPLRLLL